jgi:ParB/RepB/Spo0J family partition protein
MNPPDQPRLIPDVPPTISPTLRVPISHLFGWEHATPDRDLIRSVRQFGVLSPVLVRGQDPNYRVVAGRRRVMAVHQNGLTEVPIRVLMGDPSATDAAVLALVENSNRSPSPMDELAAIQTLLDQGATERQITEATGMSVNTIRERLRLRKAHPVLAQAAAAGDIAVSVLREAAKLPIGKQDDLVAVYHDAGKLTATHVHDARSAGTAAIGDTLFGALGLDMPAPDSESAPGAIPSPHWTTIVLARLDGLLDGVPTPVPQGVAYHISLLRTELESVGAIVQMTADRAVEKPKRGRARKEEPAPDSGA